MVFACLACTPEVNELLVKGLDSYDNEQYRTAITYFNEAIEAEPGNAELYFYRARAKMQLDSCKEAIDDYSRAIILDKTKRITSSIEDWQTYPAKIITMPFLILIMLKYLIPEMYRFILIVHTQENPLRIIPVPLRTIQQRSVLIPPIINIL